MPRADIHAEVAALVGGLPGVFSTVQWGGRAYKLGSQKKPRLLAFVSSGEEERTVSVTFKLPPARAEAIVARHAWIAPHQFRTLAPAGWVTAEVSGRRQVSALSKLLAESRGLYPGAGAADAPPTGDHATEHPATDAPPTGHPSADGPAADRLTDPVAARIDRVMADLGRRRAFDADPDP